MIRPLYSHQHRALDLLRQSLGRGKRRPLIQAPTGFGKTLLSAAIVEGARKKGNRVIFCVPAIQLVEQTVRAFEAEGLTDIGVIQGFHELTDWRQPVQVASVQTLMRRKIPDADVVVIDEAHRWFDFYGKWMSDPAWAKVPFVGLSATPWTKGLGKHYDDLIVAATTADLIKASFLSPFRVFAPSHPDLSGVKTVRGDFEEDGLAEVMNQAALIADVVDTWKRLGQNRSTLCFGVNRAHAKNLQQQFVSAGVPADYMDSYTTPEERKAIEARFHSGEVRVVCNVGVLTTGVDWDVRCIILARPTRSEILFTQIIGRGLRLAEGKEDCLILDHSDTHLRLGFVTDIMHDKLDDGRERQKAEPKAKEALPKECPSCSFLKPPKVALCPSCGFKPERKSNVTCDDGELIELPFGREEKYTIEQKRSLYGQLKFYARTRGHREGWAANKFRERTGVWPNYVKNAPEIEPSLDVLSWIRSRNIAFAKRREGQTRATAA